MGTPAPPSSRPSPPLNTTVSYTRDLRDAITQRSLTVGSSTWYQWYDSDGRGLLWNVFASTSATKPSTPDVTYTYGPSGQVESRQFAAVRLWTSAAKRFKKVANATALIWRLLLVAERRFRKLNAPELLAAVGRGDRCTDGEFVSKRRVAA